MGVKNARRLALSPLAVVYVAAAVFTFAACGALSPAPLRDTAASRTDSSSAEAHADSSSAEAELDSAGTWESAASDLFESDPARQTGYDAAASRAVDAATDTRPAFESFDLTAVTGHRSEARLQVRGWRGFSGGVRVGGPFVAGYLRYEGRGFVRGLHVGRMTIRAGERLLLGRGLGGYGSTTSGRVRGGFAVSPSLSEWFGVTGAGVCLGSGPWRLQTLAFTPADSRPQSGPGCVWGSAVGEFASGSVGVMAAWVRDTRPDVNLDAVPTRISTVAGHGVFRGGAFDVSGEIARVDGVWYFACRVAATGRRPGWSLLVFDAPYEMAPGGTAGQAPDSREQGAALGVSLRAIGVRITARATAGQRVSPSRRYAFSRLVVEAGRTGPGPLRWTLRAHGRAARETDFPSNPVLQDLSPESTRELAFRATLGIEGRGAVQTGVRVDYLPPARHLESGTVVSVGVNLVVGRFDGRVKVAGHSLPRGRPSFVSRPGIGPFEGLGTLYGEGSDLSLRLGLRLSRESRLFFFYGSSWKGSERTYVGVECKR